MSLDFGSVLLEERFLLYIYVKMILYMSLDFGSVLLEERFLLYTYVKMISPALAPDLPAPSSLEGHDFIKLDSIFYIDMNFSVSVVVD
jgi:hypothetical protein